MKNLFKKTLLLSFLIYWTFLNPISVYALGMGSMSPTGAMNGIIKSLGIDIGELKYTIQTFNASRYKKNPPQVNVLFNPTNPVPGEKVTATATPSYFMNEAKDLYFTWYIRNEECKKGSASKVDSAARGKCDPNKDGKVDIEDYKIRAAQIRVNGGYDTAGAEYDDRNRQTKDLNNDNDSYGAVSGGDDQNDKKVYCFYHDTESGKEYELKGCDNKNRDGRLLTGGHLFPFSYSMNGQGKIKQDRYIDPDARGCGCRDDIRMGSGWFSKKNDYSIRIRKGVEYYEGTCPYKCEGTDTEHERFWQSNPDDPDTAGVGTVDEATIVGLGATEFTWTYAEGDEVGVVIEGVSVEPTQKKDSSYKIMWAFSRNKCDLGNNIDESGNVAANPCAGLGDDGEDLKCTDPEMLTNKTVQDLNKCLYDNFLSPSGDTGINGKIDVTLTYDPISPINDTSDNNSGDEVSFSASVLNVSDPTYLNYKWDVSMSKEANSDVWTTLRKSELPNSTQTNGIGLDTFSFNMNLPQSLLEDNEYKYLKVRVTVTDAKSEKSTDRGNADVVFPILSSSEKIKIYASKPTEENGKVKFKLGENEICLDKDKENPTATCSVFKHEFIGVKIENESELTDFSWKLDGKPINLSECFFEGCDPDEYDNIIHTNLIHFPVLKDPGSQFTLGLEAINKSTGEKVSLSKVFSVVEPQVEIAPLDKNITRNILLGNFIDLDGKAWPDYSLTELEALSGEIIQLKAVPGSGKKDGFSSDWYVDGILVNNENYSLNTSNELSLPTKEAGEFYDVSIVADYVPDVLVKKALNEYWGISYNEFYEKQFSRDIRIKLVDSFSNSDNISQNQPVKKRILASVASGLPSYLIFLLRITLSVGLILFIVRIIFSLTPSLKKDEN